MSTVVLIRHGRSTANTAGTLAGRTPGVHLDDTGRAQAARVGELLRSVRLAGVVTSPLERCRQTAEAIVAANEHAPATQVDPAVTECDYGDWQGRQLSDLADEALWSTVQTQPSAAAFPGGESLAAMQARSVAAIRRHGAAFDDEHGSEAIWVAVSHGDIIKSVLADALGLHLDLFQRIGVDPASMSLVRYGATRPQVIAMNSGTDTLDWLCSATGSGDAPVGGGAGPEADPSARS